MHNTSGCASPWGMLHVADAHVHFFSHYFFEALAAQKPDLTAGEAIAHLGWDAPPEDARDLAGIWYREFARRGVSAAALIASVPGDEASVLAAAEVHPHRFYPFAMVNPWAIDGAAWPPESYGRMRAACLFPAMHLFSVQDPCVQPVFEWARANHRAVFVHCGVLSVGVRGKLGLPSLFDMRYSNPIDLHAVALRYPEVPVIVPHFGAGYFREALMLADLCPNVYLDTSSSNRWMKYQAGDFQLRDVFRHALEVVGPRRLLFGSDSSFFPRGWQHRVFEAQATALYEIGIAEADARAIFGENLLRILAG